MNERVLEARPFIPKSVPVYLVLVAAALAASAVFQNLHWLVGGILPLMLAIAAWFGRPKPWRCVMGDESLSVENPPLTVHYDQIQRVEAKRPANPNQPGPDSYPIVVYHEAGLLRVPGKLNVASDLAYRFFFAQLTPGGPQRMDGELTGYFERQMVEFGADRVFAYHARHQLTPGASKEASRFFLAIGVTGIIWLIAAATLHSAAWTVAGVSAVGLGFIILLALKAERSDKIKNWRRSRLVISPVGLALVQGDLKGELKWGEVQAVKEPGKGRGVHLTSATAMRGIRLQIEGAQILIADVYDRPLSIIHQQIMAYCR